MVCKGVRGRGGDLAHVAVVSGVWAVDRGGAHLPQHVDTGKDAMPRARTPQDAYSKRPRLIAHSPILYCNIPVPPAFADAFPYPLLQPVLPPSAACPDPLLQPSPILPLPFTAADSTLCCCLPVPSTDCPYPLLQPAPPWLSIPCAPACPDPLLSQPHSLQQTHC